jgi:hypothetical protein
MDERMLTWRHAGQKSPPPPFPPGTGGEIPHSFDSAEDSFTPKIQGWMGRNVGSRIETREVTRFRIFNNRMNASATYHHSGHCH